LEEQDFIKWRSALEKHSLFFDGASKGNPWAVGGGGILLGRSGMLEVSYSWGLGLDSNNMAEALTLWQGLRLAVARNIQNLVVFGDSRVIIQALKT
jgi:ribonuclease HI